MLLLKNYFYSLILILILLISCGKAKIEEVPTQVIEINNGSIVNLDSPEKLSNTLAPIEVEIINDYSFDKVMRYRCFKLEEVLDYYFGIKSLLDDDEVIFTFNCHDGYRASQMLKDIKTHEGFLAFADLDQSNGKDWAANIEDKFPPYYLVWLDREKGDKEMVWPFGVVSIELDHYSHKYKDIAPLTGEVGLPKGLSKGFSYFCKYCIKCHSINKIGGAMGPELNYPKNILEYWGKEDIWKFVQNSKNYRYNSKMPKVDIEREEFDSILIYLEYIGNHKLE